MKKINVTAVLIFLLVAFAGYKLVKRFVMLPKLTFQSEQITALDSNYTTTIAALKGNVVIVSCYQTWCGDCARELPSIQALQNKLGSDKISIVLISDEPFAKINKFKNHFRSELPFYQSVDSFKEIGIRVFPTTYLIDPKGNLLLSKLEGFDWASQEVLQIIK